MTRTCYEKNGIIVIMILIPILGNETNRNKSRFQSTTVYYEKTTRCFQPNSSEAACRLPQTEQQSLACTFKGKVKVICYRSDEPMEPS